MPHRTPPSPDCPPQRRVSLLLPLLLGLGACQRGCGNDPAPRAPLAPGQRSSATKTKPPTATPGQLDAPKQAGPLKRALLLSMAQFVTTKGPDGKEQVKPGPAKLLILHHRQGKWLPEVLEDPDSRVFHKARCAGPAQGPAQIETIGATRALLKRWTRTTAGWRGHELWGATFGGKWDRLRDFEVGDVDHDGVDEMVVGTHDQGVIVTLKTRDGHWPAIEIFRQADTFVHEIELGDSDGDGKLEIFATPSRPNRAGRSQGGGILTLTLPAGKAAPRTQWLMRFPTRHAKEILAADLDRNGKSELYVSLEAELEQVDGKPAVKTPLQILRLRRGAADRWESSTIATLSGGVQARVLLAADLDADGEKELVATTMRAGIFRLLPPPPGAANDGWRVQSVDSDSGGFEHAAAAADLDGDGKTELYVAADDQHQLRRYVWRDNRFQRQVIHTLREQEMTWTIEPCIR